MLLKEVEAKYRDRYNRTLRNRLVHTCNSNELAIAMFIKIRDEKEKEFIDKLNKGRVHKMKHKPPKQLPPRKRSFNRIYDRYLEFLRENELRKLQRGDYD